ncbi:MAG TPA: DUF6249 domain-containing protein [Caulobacteraceae bacterium]|jgi:hypothetical protein|nr:DUF6249 domain-containing protein [Caulobacteraceae bacterium]
MVETITGGLVPIAFFVCVAAIFVAPAWMRHKERQNMQDIVRVAYEKGQPVSPELITAIQSSLAIKTPSTRESDLRRAIIFIAVGVGMVGLGFGLWFGLESVSDEGAYISGASTAGVGAIPIMIGIAYLILWATGSKKSAAGQKASPLGQS